MKIQFDVTIFAPARNHARISHYTKAGEDFVQSIVREAWTPEEVMANVPPGLRVGVRTGVRKKFVQVPCHSLH